MEFVSRFFRIPDQNCFLFGPRGTGRSTWLRHRLPAARFLDLLDPPLHSSLGARPERLRELLAGSPQQRRTVVIDEIQRVPELLTVVHAVLEEPAPPRFILTGSSARKLRRGGVDRRHLVPARRGLPAPDGAGPGAAGLAVAAAD